MAADLTDSFSYAYEYAASWTPDDLNAAVHAILDRIAQVVDDWDASSGEEWVQFSAEGAPILYLRVDFPLGVILNGYEALLDGINVVVVPVDDFHQTRYRMDAEAMRTMLSPEVSGGVNPNGFTISELWRAAI